MSQKRKKMKIDCIDTAIYLKGLFSILEEKLILNTLAKSNGLEILDQSQFEQDFKEEIELVALTNKANLGDPILTDTQIEDVFMLCVVKDGLPELIRLGLVEQEFSMEQMANVIKLKQSNGSSYL